MVHIKTIGGINPLDVEAPQKFYAHAVSAGKVDLERLAYLVFHPCTMRESDCHTVLLALEHNITYELRNGKMVQLGKSGHFQIGVRSVGKELLKAVRPASVKRAHMNFRQGKRLRKHVEPTGL